MNAPDPNLSARDNIDRMKQRQRDDHADSHAREKFNQGQEREFIQRGGWMDPTVLSMLPQIRALVRSEIDQRVPGFLSRAGLPNGNGNVLIINEQGELDYTEFPPSAPPASDLMMFRPSIVGSKVRISAGVLVVIHKSATVEGETELDAVDGILYRSRIYRDRWTDWTIGPDPGESTDRRTFRRAQIIMGPPIKLIPMSAGILECMDLKPACA